MPGKYRKFLSLEGLRGILALLVCAGHLGLNTLTNKIGFNVRFGLSVDVFFALSGFVLAYSNFFGRRTFRRYVIGRIARLYPLHFLTLVIMAILVIAQGGTFDFMVFSENVLLVQNIGLPPNHWGFNFPSWSISVEVWVSLAFFLFCSMRSWKLAVGFLAIAFLIAIAVPNLPNYDETNILRVINYGLLRGVAGFGVGVAAFLTFERLQAIPEFLWRLAAYAGLVILAGLFCLPSWPPLINLMFYAVIFVTLMALARTDGRLWLSRPIFVGAGAISYSVYLLHIPIYSYLAAIFGNKNMHGAVKLLVFPLIILISMVVHKRFEMTFQQQILRIAKSPFENRDSQEL